MSNPFAARPTYEDLLQHVLEHGEERSDRTGVGTLNVFGAQLRFDLLGQFPLITSKRVFWRGVVEELLWFIRGSTDNNELVERGIHIWDEWAREDGSLGPIYGRQWRSWGAGFAYQREPSQVYIADRKIDQLRDVIEQIKTNPFSRRHIVSAWNPGELPQMALPPCHVLFQFDVSRDGRLNCQLYQRSADLFLGVPFNIASYALLTRMIAKECGLLPGEFIHTFGSAHIYLNHVDQVVEQLSREPRPFPELVIDHPPGTSIFNMVDPTRFKLHGYDPHPPIKGEVAV